MIETVSNWFVIVFFMAMIIFLAWVTFFKNPATNVQKSNLIEAAVGCKDAELYVRDVLMRKNLQQRHYFAAMRYVNWLIEKAQEKSAAKTIDAFLSSNAGSK